MWTTRESRAPAALRDAAGVDGGGGGGGGGVKDGEQSRTGRGG